MSGYRNIANMIFRKYRIVRSIIWSIECIDSQKFRTNIIQLIGIVYYFILILYSKETDLIRLNDYYAEMCIDEIYEDFVIEIATKVAKQVKGKVYYGYATLEDMWYVIVKTRELGEKRFFLDTLDYDMLSGVSSKEIADDIVKFYRKIIEKRFFIV